MPLCYTPSVSEPTKEQLHAKILQSLQAAITCCDKSHFSEFFSVPPAKIPIHSLFSDFNDESDPAIFDVVVDGFPWGLPEVQVIEMVWDGFLTSSRMSFAALQIDQETSLYFQFDDSEEDQPHFLAFARGVSPEVAHLAFLEELISSNGSAFDTVIFGSPPNEISSMFSVSKLVDPLLSVVDDAIENGCTDFWEEILTIISRNPATSDLVLDVSTKRGQRKTMRAYLKAVM